MDQLVEIIKVLGTPSREEIHNMNPNYTEFKFPQIKAHPWTKVFSKRMPPDAINLVRPGSASSGTLHFCSGISGVFSVIEAYGQGTGATGGTFGKGLGEGAGGRLRVAHRQAEVEDR